VSARFSVGKDAVVLVIEDDGGGFDMDALGASGISASWGLLSMRERAQAVGGTTRVESSLGAGTRVTIEVPR
jgi:signal transduction histidine kinase